jgi:hypothetical protein
MMERPESIVWFERCYLGAVALGLINFALSWNVVIAKSAANPGLERLGPSFLPTMMIGIMAITLCINLLLWYFAARKGAVVAKWIIVIFFGISVLSLGLSVPKGNLPAGLSGVLTIVAFVLHAIAVWQLFKPDADAWFKAGGVDSGRGPNI